MTLLARVEAEHRLQGFLPHVLKLLGDELFDLVEPGERGILRRSAIGEGQVIDLMPFIKNPFSAPVAVANQVCSA